MVLLQVESVDLDSLEPEDLELNSISYIKILQSLEENLMEQTHLSLI